MKLRDVNRYMKLINEFCPELNIQYGSKLTSDIFPILMPYCLNSIGWLGCVLWHINHCGLFNTKSCFLHINSLTVIEDYPENFLFNSYFFHSFPWITPLILNSYLIMLSDKQGSIKYHFFEFLIWSNLGLNPGLPNYYANGLYIYIYIYMLWVWFVNK